MDHVNPVLDGLRAAADTVGPSLPHHTFDGTEEVEKTQKVADIAFTSQYPGLSNYITSILNLPRCYKVLSHHNLYDRETKNEAGIRFVQSLIGMTTAFLNTVNIVRILATDGLCLKLFTFTPLFIILSIPIVLIEIAICIYYLNKQASFSKDPLFELQDILTKPHDLLTLDDMVRLNTYIDEHAEYFEKTLGLYYCEKNIDESIKFQGVGDVHQLVNNRNSLREKLFYLQRGCQQLDQFYQQLGSSAYDDNINGMKLRFQLFAQQLFLESFRKTHLEITEEEKQKYKQTHPHYNDFDPLPEEFVQTITQKKLTLAKRIYPGLRDSLCARANLESLHETDVIQERVDEVSKNLLEINSKRKAKHYLLIVKIVAMSLVLITTILALTGCPIAYLPLALLLIAYAIDIFHWIIEECLSKRIKAKMIRKHIRQAKEALQIPLRAVQGIYS